MLQEMTMGLLWFWHMVMVQTMVTTVKENAASQTEKPEKLIHQLKYLEKFGRPKKSQNC